jgi:hypothetical protein
MNRIPQIPLTFIIANPLYYKNNENMKMIEKYKNWPYYYMFDI